MTKKTLQSYRARQREIRQLEDMIADLETRMTSPKIQQLTGMPTGGSHDHDKMTAMVAKHLQLLGRYTEKTKELAAVQLEIEEAIDAMEPHERELLRRRYIQGEYWEDICVHMSYSWRQVHRIHSAALQKLEGGQHGKNE